MLSSTISYLLRSMSSPSIAELVGRLLAGYIMLRYHAMTSAVAARTKSAAQRAGRRGS